MSSTAATTRARTTKGRAQVVEWLADPKYRVDGLVTSVFDLDQWKTAVETASAGPRARSVKATIRPNPDIALVK
jgi:threonine dehydrogenase-like Zn-dependent dehydrogenase